MNIDKTSLFKQLMVCPLCGEKKQKKQFMVLQLIWHISVNKCTNCGIVYKTYQPNDKLLKYIYSDSYIHFNVDKEHDIYNSRVKRLGKKKQGCLRHLDYGCGAGGFVESSLKQGWDSYGCDPFLPDEKNLLITERLHKLDIQKPDIIKTLGTFDVISMWAVAEHLTDPLTTFKALTKLLKPGGRLVFNWPNGNSFVAVKKGKNWGIAILLEHLTFITPKSIGWLAKELDLSIGKMRVCGTPYPLGIIDNPSLKNQGIAKFPPSLRMNNQQNEIAKNVKEKPPETYKKYLIKKIINVFRVGVLEKNSSGFLAQLFRNVTHYLKLGDHLEVVFIKRK